MTVSGQKRTRFDLLFFRLGAYGLIVTAVFHMVGHLSGFPPPANETEVALIELVDTYEFSITGLSRTLRDFERV